MLTMNPKVNTFNSCNRVGLCAFIFVMRKTQINSTHVNVYMSLQKLKGHCRALNMPTRKSRTPRGIPNHFASITCCFPQGPISMKFLCTIFYELITVTGFQSIQTIATYLSISSKRLCIKVNALIFTNICRTLLNKFGNHFVHELNRFTSPWILFCRNNVQIGKIVMKAFFIFTSDFKRINLLFL